MKIVLFPITLLFLFSCGNGSKPGETQLSSDTTQAAPYFPVLDFLKSEIAYVDSLPGGIRKYYSSNGRSDSTYIPTSEFDKLAAEFTSEELEQDKMQTNFKEQSFFDNTINASTFLYEARQADNPIRRIHVLSRPDAAYDKIISIYIEKFVQNNDSFLLQKMTWKPGKEFLINKEAGSQAGGAVMSQTRVVWDYGEEQQ